MGKEKTLPDELQHLEKFEISELLERTQKQLELLWVSLTNQDFGSGPGEKEGAQYVIESLQDNLKAVSYRVENGGVR